MSYTHTHINQQIAEELKRKAEVEAAVLATAAAVAEEARLVEAATRNGNVEVRYNHYKVWGSVVPCGVVWCSVVQCGAVWCSVVQCGAVWCSMVQCGAMRCNAVQYGAVWCNVVQCGAVWCNAVQCGAVW